MLILKIIYFYKNQNDRNLEASVGSDPGVGGGIGVSGVSSWVAVGGALGVSPGDVSEENFLAVLDVGEWSAGVAHAGGGAGVVSALLSAGEGLKRLFKKRELGLRVPGRARSVGRRRW